MRPWQRDVVEKCKAFIEKKTNSESINVVVAENGGVGKTWLRDYMRRENIAAAIPDICIREGKSKSLQWITDHPFPVYVFDMPLSLGVKQAKQVRVAATLAICNAKKGSAERRSAMLEERKAVKAEQAAEKFFKEMWYTIEQIQKGMTAPRSGNYSAYVESSQKPAVWVFTCEPPPLSVDKVTLWTVPTPNDSLARSRKTGDVNDANGTVEAEEQEAEEEEKKDVASSPIAPEIGQEDGFAENKDDDFPTKRAAARCEADTYDDENPAIIRWRSSNTQDRVKESEPTPPLLLGCRNEVLPLAASDAIEDHDLGKHRSPRVSWVGDNTDRLAATLPMHSGETKRSARSLYRPRRSLPSSSASPVVWGRPQETASDNIDQRLAPLLLGENKNNTDDSREHNHAKLCAYKEHKEDHGRKVDRERARYAKCFEWCKGRRHENVGAHPRGILPESLYRICEKEIGADVPPPRTFTSIACAVFCNKRDGGIGNVLFGVQLSDTELAAANSASKAKRQNRRSRSKKAGTASDHNDAASTTQATGEPSATLVRGGKTKTRVSENKEQHPPQHRRSVLSSSNNSRASSASANPKNSTQQTASLGVLRKAPTSTSRDSPLNTKRPLLQPATLTVFSSDTIGKRGKFS